MLSTKTLFCSTGCCHNGNDATCAWPLSRPPVVPTSVKRPIGRRKSGSCLCCGAVQILIPGILFAIVQAGPMRSPSTDPHAVIFVLRRDFK